MFKQHVNLNKKKSKFLNYTNLHLYNFRYKKQSLNFIQQLSGVFNKNCKNDLCKKKHIKKLTLFI